jgi:hypothetical protein
MDRGHRLRMFSDATSRPACQSLTEIGRFENILLACHPCREIWARSRRVIEGGGTLDHDSGTEKCRGSFKGAIRIPLIWLGPSSLHSVDPLPIEQDALKDEDLPVRGLAEAVGNWLRPIPGEYEYEVLIPL